MEARARSPRGRQIVVCFSILLMVAACGGGGADVNTRYESVFDMREIVEDAGITCDTWEVIGDVINAVERAECTRTVVFSIHESASQARAAVDDVAAVSTGLLDRRSGHLIGPNWSMNCGDDVELCERLLPALGGELDVQHPEDN